MALDIGSRFVGVAVGNFSRMEQGYMPTPLPPFIMPESVNAFCKSVFALVSKEKADTVILGYPIPVHSHEKDKKTLDFKKKIKAWARRLERYSEKRGEKKGEERGGKIGGERGEKSGGEKGGERGGKIGGEKGGEKNNEGQDSGFRVFLQNEAFTTYAARQRNPLLENLSHGISKRNLQRASSEKMAKKGVSNIKNIDSFSACEILMVYVDKMVRQKSRDSLAEKK